MLPLPGDAAVAYGEIRAVLEAHGEMIRGNDLWIAAQIPEGNSRNHQQAHPRPQAPELGHP